MSQIEQFVADIQAGYAVQGDYFQLGAAVLNGQVISDAPINVPLKMLNRHGLIAGATGTGKTKTLQFIAEKLSEKGIPTLMMDIKGDLSGLAASGEPQQFILDRYQKLGLPYSNSAFPVELLTLSEDSGAQLRTTVAEMGPLFLSKILDLNDTQSGILSVLFKYADDNGLLLLDLKDLIQLIKYAQEDGKSSIESHYGKLSGTSLSTILRKIIALQQQGIDNIFGEPSFEVQDLIYTTREGKGVINILRLTDMQEKPDVFSTFMLQMLVELFQVLPEVGDKATPKLILFIDEAHLIFKNPSKELLEQLEITIKLIRSKGVGIFFCTQNPYDIPASILSQLGMKVQHALRAFTAQDRKNIKQTADNYPISNYYKTDELLTSVGIGEAVITLLNEKGSPTPLVHCFLGSPASRMDVLTDGEIQNLLQNSHLYKKYSQSIDRTSAFEILSSKIPETATTTKKEKITKPEKSTLEKVLESSAGKQIQRSIVRTIFGTLEKTLKKLF